MSNSIKCCLESIQDLKLYSLKNKESYIIGRNSKSLIKILDTFCSKKQVEIIGDFDNNQILIKNIGKSSLGINGCHLPPNNQINLRHNDIIEIVYGQLAFKVKFDPVPNYDIYQNNKSPHKRFAPNTINNSANKKLKLQNMDNSWDSVGNGKLLVYTATGVISKTKLACYDLDGTIIKTINGNVFPKDYNDWKIAYPNVITKLKNLYNNGYKIVLFTNQAGISIGKTKTQPFKKKIENILSKLNIPMQVFISTGDSIFRKPIIGMWTELIENRNDGLVIDKENSFFCGDAAGRVKTSKRKKDFSSSDRLFALNCTLNFYTPEEHFLNEPPEPYELPTFRPKLIKNNQLLDPSSEPIQSSNQEMVVLVGYPGSGKSYFSTKYFTSPYIIVSQDISGSWQTCLRLADNALNEGKSVCVDNTNPDPESRNRWIKLAKSFNIQVRCFKFNVSYEHAIHNIKFRELTDNKHSKINNMILNVYKSKFKEPTIEEGFHSIIKVNFVPHFENKNNENLYYMYLT